MISGRPRRRERGIGSLEFLRVFLENLRKHCTYSNLYRAGNHLRIVGVSAGLQLVNPSSTRKSAAAWKSQVAARLRALRDEIDHLEQLIGLTPDFPDAA